MQQKSEAALPCASVPAVPVLHVTFEKSVSGLSEPVQEKPYHGLPAESGTHPATVGSASHVSVLLELALFRVHEPVV